MSLASVFEIDLRLAVVRKRLDARTKGLLELDRDLDATKGDMQHLQTRVDFLHRTVCEFMQQPHVKDRFVRLNDAAFNADETIYYALLAIIKLAPIDLKSVVHVRVLEELFEDFLFHHSSSETALATEMIDELDQVLAEVYPAIEEHIPGSGKSPRLVNRGVLRAFEVQSLFELCVQRGKVHYVGRKLHADPSLANFAWRRPLPLHALLPGKSHKYPHPDPGPMVTLLMQHGCEVNALYGNAQYGHRTCWDLFFDEVVRDESSQSTLQQQRREILPLLLDAGANIRPGLFGTVLWKFSGNTRMKLLEILFRCGINPNEAFGNSRALRPRTMWTEWLYEITATSNYGCEITRLFLEYGADPPVSFVSGDFVKRSGENEWDVGRVLFQAYNGEQLQELQELIELVKRKRKQRTIIGLFSQWLKY